MKRSLLVAVFSVWVVCGMCANDTLTRAQVYNFSVGDTFDYMDSFAVYPVFVHINYRRYVVQSIFYSANGDTLKIVRKVEPPLTTAYDTLIINQLDTFEFDSFIIQESCDSSYFIDTNSWYNGKTLNKIYCSCFENYYTSSYCEGLGNVYAEDGGKAGPFNEYAKHVDRLIYYSKGSEKWGTPMEIYLGANELTKNFNSVSPNPATTYFNLQLQQTPTAPTVFQLFDITGRMVLQQPLTVTTNRVELNGVSKGMYLYSVLRQAEHDKQHLGAGKLVVE